MFFFGNPQVEEVVCQLTYQDMSLFNAVVSGWSSRLLLANQEGETVAAAAAAAATPARRSASAPGLSPGLSTPTAVTPAVSPRGGTAGGLPSSRGPAGMAAPAAASLKGAVALSDSEYGEEEELAEEEEEEEVWQPRDPRVCFFWSRK